MAEYAANAHSQSVSLIEIFDTALEKFFDVSIGTIVQKFFLTSVFPCTSPDAEPVTVWRRTLRDNDLLRSGVGLMDRIADETQSSSGLSVRFLQVIIRVKSDVFFFSFRRPRTRIYISDEERKPEVSSA